jgi:hypothetical protein
MFAHEIDELLPKAFRRVKVDGASELKPIEQQIGHIIFLAICLVNIGFQRFDMAVSQTSEKGAELKKYADEKKIASIEKRAAPKQAWCLANFEKYHENNLDQADLKFIMESFVMDPMKLFNVDTAVRREGIGEPQGGDARIMISKGGGQKIDMTPLNAIMKAVFKTTGREGGQK